MKKFLISCLCCVLALPVWANELKSLRIAPIDERTRVVFDLTEKPVFTYSFSEQPPRVTVEFKSINSTLATMERQGGKLGPVISAVHRTSSPGNPNLTITFDLNGPVRPQVFTLTPQQKYDHRVVLDFSHKEMKAVRTGGAAVPATTPSASSRSVSTSMAANSTAPRANGKSVSGRVIPMSEFSPNPTNPQFKPQTTTAAPVTASTQSKIRPNDVTIKEETLSTQVRTPGKESGPEQDEASSLNSAPVMSRKPEPVAAQPEPQQDQPQDEAAASDSSEISGSNQVIVAVDAGHGGKDPGAIGTNGTQEKSVTLSVARELAALINKQPGMKAIMTRTGDYFVDLDERSEIARRKKAQLLISIHADSVDNSTARGASVWILSNKRVDREMNKLLVQQDKHTQLLGGAGKVIAEAEPNPYLAQTILDLSWDNSRSEGYNIGEDVLNQIGRVARLHKSKPVHASLAVLKAPDIPSLLIETGFISNQREEQQLASHDYQQQLATAIFRGVRGYYAENPPAGTRVAKASSSKGKAGTIRHVVKAGENAASVAQRYGISERQLRERNKLKSGQLQVGQILYIPASSS